jgi:cyclic pyranopterin phosphate synthase
MGVTKIRLTGGEPLMRPGIVSLVGELAGLPGLRDLAMTTNGTLLSEFARDLAAAGLQRVNVSLDTADPLRFKRITRGGDIHRVWAGIAAARQAGLGPIKINCVRGTHTGPEDIAAVKALGDREGLEVRVIQEMSFARGAFAVIGRGSGGDCTRCNRLRLTCNGFLRPCLFSDRVFDIRQLGCKRAIEQAVFSKPHAGGPCSHRAMVGLGG